MDTWIGKIEGAQIIDLYDPEHLGSTAALITPSSMAKDGDTVEISDSVAVLATADSALSKVYDIIAKAGLNPHHSDACEQEAQQWLLEPGIDSPSLMDRRDLPFVTIDNPDSKDLDQALFIKREANSNLTIYYALADASYYIRPGSALFQEAVTRGATFYVPGLSIPMLPRSLSENLVSLNPQVERRAVVFVITIDQSGNVISTELERARIVSVAKLSYTGVQVFYDAQQESTKHEYDDSAFEQSLLNLKEAGLRRMRHAEERDVVDHNRLEANVKIEHSNTINEAFSIEVRERCDCERYNEQISLLCNMQGAQLLKKLDNKGEEQDRDIDLQSVFRIHSPPLQDRIAQLRESIEEVAKVHQLPAEWLWEQSLPLADYLDSLPQSPHTAPIRAAIERQILLTNRASFFSSEPGPHHALGVTAYARFSSPMREVVGIFTHKECLEGLQLEDAGNPHYDTSLQQAIIKRANETKKVQKKLDQEFRLLAIDQFFRSDLALPPEQRPIRSATVMSMRGGKIYVSIKGFGADVKIYTNDLGKQFHCRFKVESVSAVPYGTELGSNPAPVFHIGDQLNLQTTAFDAGNRRFVLSPQ